MADPKAPNALLHGALDGLILKVLSRGPSHGYAVARFIRDGSDGSFRILDGALYTSLHRMEERGWVDASWGNSDKGKRAKFYQLTTAGRKALRAEAASWDRYVIAVAKAEKAQVADAWGDELDAAGLRAARLAGCDCPDSLPGGLTLVETRRAPAGSVGAVPVVHQLFSDGLVSASLFTLQGSLTDADTEGLRARGFTLTDLDGLSAWVRGGKSSASSATVVWECDDDVLTLVADDALRPLAVAQAVLSALPPTRPTEDDSFLGRVARGWDRVTGGGS
mgnify:CR=1 FL=1